MEEKMEEGEVGKAGKERPSGFAPLLPPPGIATPCPDTMYIRRLHGGVCVTVHSKSGIFETVSPVDESVYNYREAYIDSNTEREYRMQATA